MDRFLVPVRDRAQLFYCALNNPPRQWALLVAYIMFVLSLAPIMSSFGGDVPAYFGSIFLLAIAIPFFIVYFRSEDNWWAIIPSGVTTTLAILATLGIAGWIDDTEASGIPNAILMGGLAATFAVLWLRHTKSWARDRDNRPGGVGGCCRFLRFRSWDLLARGLHLWGCVSALHCNAA
ncbi:MAG: hypothetical protein MZU84_07070 [Sphingobacterium sp.]|nr:hypothetical protein [Sphingobacterium sp.]